MCRTVFAVGSPTGAFATQVFVFGSYATRRVPLFGTFSVSQMRSLSSEAMP